MAKLESLHLEVFAQTAIPHKVGNSAAIFLEKHPTKAQKQLFLPTT